jgi:SAM-dependent methyltransferase
MISKEPFGNNREEYIINLINPDKNKKILNIGIANIPEIEMFLEDRVKECSTIDIDKKKLENASKYLKKTKLIEGDINKLELKKNYYDVVVILEVLEHLDNDTETIRLIHSILKKNGEIILSVPNKSILHLINPVMYIEHKRHYSNKDIKKKLETAGFEIVHFNVVETWTLLLNLYIHLFNKFILRRESKFNKFKKIANATYRQKNKRGIDLVIKAKKI